ncbi:hypothetical protein ACIPYQ_12410 [Streptomyces sp. NPDC090045]|uniref:terpene synthase family protein n=1 Tax=Streptomyces sp. NPDC090045 TaxID=3365927 RepID=UPI0038053E96
MAFFFVFDDQFDGPLGQDPARAAAACRQLIDIVHGAAPAAGADACSVAFADLWARSCGGAPPGWVARTAYVQRARCGELPRGAPEWPTG